MVSPAQSADMKAYYQIAQMLSGKPLDLKVIEAAQAIFDNTQWGVSFSPLSCSYLTFIDVSNDPKAAALDLLAQARRSVIPRSNSLTDDMFKKIEV